MIDRARQAMARAHAPYSRFQVGACVRAASGALYSGCNVENASYPEGWCAETSALAAMVGAGDRELVEVVVMAPGESPCSPCGGCRQRLRELGSAATRVHLCNPQGLLLTVSLGELLPHAFAGDLLPGSSGRP
ncbi:MAG: cytidine deaminase [Acidobacteria bacterium]|nr:cytidine deaminase [Acidobacteriota bacterium]